MFGGFGVYADGTMFGLAAGGEVHLKADTAFAETLADLGSQPFAFSRRNGRVVTGPAGGCPRRPMPIRTCWRIFVRVPWALLERGVDAALLSSVQSPASATSALRLRGFLAAGASEAVAAVFLEAALAEDFFVPVPAVLRDAAFVFVA